MIELFAELLGLPSIMGWTVLSTRCRDPKAAPQFQLIDDVLFSKIEIHQMTFDIEVQSGKHVEVYLPTGLFRSERWGYGWTEITEYQRSHFFQNLFASGADPGKTLVVAEPPPKKKPYRSIEAILKELRYNLKMDSGGDSIAPTRPIKLRGQRRFE